MYACTGPKGLTQVARRPLHKNAYWLPSPYLTRFFFAQTYHKTYQVIIWGNQEVLAALAMVKNGWLLQTTFSEVYYYENYLFLLTILTYVVVMVKQDDHIG